MRALNEAQPVSDNSEGIQERSAFLDDASALVTPVGNFLLIQQQQSVSECAILETTDKIFISLLTMTVTTFDIKKSRYRSLRSNT